MTNEFTLSDLGELMLEFSAIDEQGLADMLTEHAEYVSNLPKKPADRDREPPYTRVFSDGERFVVRCWAGENSIAHVNSVRGRTNYSTGKVEVGKDAKLGDRNPWGILAGNIAAHHNVQFDGTYFEGTGPYEHIEQIRDTLNRIIPAQVAMDERIDKEVKRIGGDLYGGPN